jgi:Xaa-Pro aminopeptidase
VDFDEELWAVMAVKSSEEIACMERAMVAVETGIEALYSNARAGVRIPRLAGQIFEGVVGGGSELAVQVLLSAGKTTPRAAGRIFPDRVLEDGDLVINEIAGKYCGYWAQGHAPVSVGRRPKPETGRIFDASLAALQVGMQMLKPGVSTHDLAEAVQRPIRDAGYEVNLMPLFKGIGLTIAEPPYSPTGVGLDASGRAPTYILAEGQTIFFEPAAWDRRSNVGVHIGEQVVVTSAGCRRLGKRSLELRIT